MTAGAPTVGVVVVNYNGGDLTLGCLHSLLRTEWPADRLRVVLVDNASHDGIADRVRDELPVVEVVDLPSNRGFGAGCNAGIRALGAVDFVALVNNDAYVEPDWLSPLVDTLVDDPGLGAACPKILFAGRFHDVELRSATYRRGFGDRRDLGVFLSGARVDGADVWSRVQLVDGTWGLEPDAAAGGEWTGTVTHLRVPVPASGSATTVSLLLHADGPRAISLAAGADVVEHTVGTEPAWFDVVATADGIDVVNNVGTELLADGFAVDRGYLERRRRTLRHARRGVRVVRRRRAAPAGVPRRRRAASTRTCSSTTRTSSSRGAAPSAGGATAPCRRRSCATCTPPPAAAARRSSSTTTSATASSCWRVTARPAPRARPRSGRCS